MAKGYWLNTTRIIKPNAAKPCHALKFCPYGSLVEEFPIHRKLGKYGCTVFGHHCPVFYHYENTAEV